jgi:RNA polymerase sigma factor (TIGR02999 family)
VSEKARSRAFHGDAGGPRPDQAGAAPTGEVTRLIQAAGGSDRVAAEQLFTLTLVYDELKRLAQQRMRGERAGNTLQATALVHETYLRLVGDAEVHWQGRRHFFAAAAEAMRRILIDRARHKRRVRHGGELQRVDLEAVDLAASAAPAEDDRLLALDAALTRLAEAHPFKAELIKLRHFGGLSIEDAAEVLGVSRATAYRHWEYARAWLLRELEGARPGET